VRQAPTVVAFAVSTAVVSLVGGWWLIPVLAAVWVRVLPRRWTSAPGCAVGAALGWGTILLWASTEAPIATAGRRVAGIFHLPGWAFAAVTLGFAAALAGFAAAAAKPTSIR
jgi:hypothetical protein